MRINISGSVHILLVAAAVIGTVIWMFQPEQQEAFEAAQEKAAIVAQQEERFFEPDISTGVGWIIVDRETGVCYYFRKYMNAGGMTVLVDAEGKPMIWEEERS